MVTDLPIPHSREWRLGTNWHRRLNKGETRRPNGCLQHGKDDWRKDCRGYWTCYICKRESYRRHMARKRAERW